MHFSKLSCGAAVLCILALTACSKKKVTVQHDVDGGSEVFEFVKPNKGIVTDPVHGKELWLSIGAIAGENGIAANGLGQMHFMEDGMALVSLQVNIHPAIAGYEYHAYLVNPAGERVDIGTLDTLSDVRHRLNYDAKRDLRTHSLIEITLNKAGSAEPGTLQAKGTMAERKRKES